MEKKNEQTSSPNTNGVCAMRLEVKKITFVNIRIACVCVSRNHLSVNHHVPRPRLYLHRFNEVTHRNKLSIMIELGDGMMVTALRKKNVNSLLAQCKRQKFSVQSTCKPNFSKRDRCRSKQRSGGER